MGNKIAIMGVGAVGGYAGAHMAQAGEDVTFIDPWPAHVEKMQRDGLKISHIRDVPEFTAKVRAMHVTDAQQLAKERPIDIAFVCMKSYDTEWAATLISQYLAPGGFIVSLQNCMNEETIAGVVGWGKTMGCIASSITVDLCEPDMCAAPPARAARVTRVPHREVHGRSPTGRRSAAWSAWPTAPWSPRTCGAALVEAGDQRDGQRPVGVHRMIGKDMVRTTRSATSPPG
jgi:2-dehydropantoate 2-reductase